MLEAQTALITSLINTVFQDFKKKVFLLFLKIAHLLYWLSQSILS